MDEKDLLEEIQKLNDVIQVAKEKAVAQVTEIERLNMVLKEQYAVIDKVQAAILRLQSLGHQLNKRNPAIRWRQGDGEQNESGNP